MRPLSDFFHLLPRWRRCFKVKAPSGTQVKLIGDRLGFPRGDRSQEKLDKLAEKLPTIKIKASTKSSFTELKSIQMHADLESKDMNLSYFNVHN